MIIKRKQKEKRITYKWITFAQFANLNKKNIFVLGHCTRHKVNSIIIQRANSNAIINVEAGLSSVQEEKKVRRETK